MTRKEDEETDVALLHDDVGLSEASDITSGSRLEEQKKTGEMGENKTTARFKAWREIQGAPCHVLFPPTY